jgi:hypothetical protein
MWETSIRTHTHTHTHINAYMHTHTQMHVYTHIHRRMHIEHSMDHQGRSAHEVDAMGLARSERRRYKHTNQQRYQTTQINRLDRWFDSIERQREQTRFGGRFHIRKQSTQNTPYRITPHYTLLQACHFPHTHTHTHDNHLFIHPLPHKPSGAT